MIVLFVRRLSNRLMKTYTNILQDKRLIDYAPGSINVNADSCISSIAEKYMSRGATISENLCRDPYLIIFVSSFTCT